MKKLLSALILLCMIAGVFAGSFTITASASTTKAELEQKLNEARELYFSGGTEQTRKYLYGKLAAADAVIIDDSAAQPEIDNAYERLAAAVDGFLPMTVSGRVNLNGVDKWTQEQVERMNRFGLSSLIVTDVKPEGASQSLKLTAYDSYVMFINRPGEDGAYSPFGVDMYFSDGLALWLSSDNYDAVGSIELYVGKSTAESEEMLSVYDIPVTKEGYVYVPWEIFYPEVNYPDSKIDLSGAMNLLGFAVSGEAGASVYISDVHAFVETIEKDDRVYEEVKVTAFDQIDNEHIYKISDPATGKVVTWGPALTETVYKQQASSSRLDWTSSNQSFSLSEGNGDDVTQQWQIYKQLRSGDYHIINQGTSATMARGTTLSIGTIVIESGKLALEHHEDLDNPRQKWSVTESNGRFVFKSGSKYLGISGGVPDLVSSAYEWDVYECVTDEWVEVWGDEFDGNSIDRTKWNVANGKVRGDSEPATFRDDPNNIYVKNGELVIRTVKEDYGNYHATSGYMDTQGIYGVTYGKIEMRAKLTDGKRSWPAFWSMGQYGNWPYNGELDMMEFDISDNASDPYAIYGTNHWFTYQGNLYGSDTSNDYMIHAAKGTTIYNENKEPYADDYHTFTVEWDEKQARTYVDGMMYMSMLLTTDEIRWGFGDNPHYLILNVSTKGPGNNQIYSDMADETFMYVDYVRVYKRAGEVSDAPAYNDEVLNASNVVTGSGWMCALDASPDGKYVASSDRGTVYLTDTSDNSLLKSNSCGYNEISKILFSDDGTKIAVASRGDKVVILDSPALTRKATGSFPHVYVEAVDFNADGSKLFAGGRISGEADSSIPSKDVSQYVYIMDTATGAVTEGPFTGSNVRTLKVSPDGTKLAAACANGKIIVYNITGGALTEYAVFTDHIHCARGLDWSPDGALLATTDEGGKIFVYDVAAKTMKYEAANVSRASIRTCEFSPDGTKLLVSGSTDGGRLFDAASGKLLSVMGGFGQAVPTARWSPDGKMILLMSLEGYGRLYTANGEYLRTLNGRQEGTYAIHNAVFGAGGTKVYGITYHNKANTLCWNLGTGSLDTSELEAALRDAAVANPDDYSARAWGVLEGIRNKYKKLARIYTADQGDVTAAARTVRCAVALKDNEPFGFKPWQTSDTSLMTVTTCRATMRDVTDGDVTHNALCVYSTRTKWEFNNKTAEGIVKNPFVADMRDYSGLKFKTYSTKDVTDSDILIGYPGEEEDTIYKFNVGAIGADKKEITAPFDQFVRVSGDGQLDLSRLEIIGFTGAGKSTTGVYYYDLTAYQEEGEMPVITGVEDGGEYDAPVNVTWNTGRGELNGFDVGNGVTINEPGDYVLKVINLDKIVTVRFRVNEGAPGMPGDVDRDGEITVSDVLICLRVSAGLMTVDANCDVDGDGEVTVVDALVLLRIALGIVPQGSGIRGIALICDAPVDEWDAFTGAAYKAIDDFGEKNHIYRSAYYPLGDDFDNGRLIDDASAEGCDVFVVIGFMMTDLIAEKVPQYPDAKFVLIDVSRDELLEAAGENVFDYGNVLCLTYREEAAGFLAGYAAVKLGYDNLGFLGGMPIPAVTRYGYGFLQGADAAASELGITAKVKFAYANSFAPSEEITENMCAWYDGGVQAVFACGGGISLSVAEAAQEKGGKLIGVDSDQSVMFDEGLVLTSAIKGIYPSVFGALETIREGNWADCAGRHFLLGFNDALDPENNFVQLPYDTTLWNQAFGQEDYAQLISRLCAGELTVSDEIDTAPSVTAASVEYVEF
ncbi:MAG: BMP family ABC transporter substrate-binding protein [Clostridia bacterium]|nr:BMP family ABC transporter substrate-binding protein [Clostridia bacterium]